MIYITGDTHGDELRFIEGNMHGETEWTEDDYLIVCGDFGYIFTDWLIENQFLDFLSRKPYTICFCDGNHENFPRIYKYPEESWNGGRVHKIRANILHLMRGQVFKIEGYTIFTMGGAYSIDKHLRKDGQSWWKEEMPTTAEYREAINNLERANKSVDFIITHTAPGEIIKKFGKSPSEHDMELIEFLDRVMREVKFNRWYFGHWHMDREIGDKFRAVWFNVIPINEREIL